MDEMPNPITKELGKRILDIKTRVVAHFTAENWTEFGLLTGHTDLIKNHGRLLRSLQWNDPDYADNAQEILYRIARIDLPALEHMEAYLNEKYPGDSVYVSSQPATKKLTFAPNVFAVPENISVEDDLAAVMMPFSAEFNAVHAAIKQACNATGFRCVRGDDIWDNATVIQDVFNLILRARVVIVDFSGKNPNVMYETGIAHTLGKTVVPISQSMADVPFDVKHHRVLTYLPNSEGINAMRAILNNKLLTLGPGNSWRLGSSS